MTELEMWAIVIGFLAPPVLAVIMQPKWSESFRAFVGFLFAILLGVGNVYFNGEFDHESGIVKSILLVLVSSIATFKGFWKPTGVANAIETKTSSSQTPMH